MSDDIDIGGSSIIKLTSEKEADALLKAGGPVMIIYYAKWCGHCQGSYDAWKELSKKVDGKAKVYMIESSNYPKITSFPTIKIVKEGNAVPYEEEREVETMKKALLGENGGRRRSRRFLRRARKTKRALRRNVAFAVNLRVTRGKRR